MVDEEKRLEARSLQAGRACLARASWISTTTITLYHIAEAIRLASLSTVTQLAAKIQNALDFGT